MRTVEESRKRWDVLLNYSPSFVDLNDLLRSKDRDNPCEDGLRSVCWKTFLLYRNIDQSLWPAKLSDSREAYSSLRDHFLKYIERPDDLSSTVDPLAEDETSPWQSLRRDEAIRAEIYQDVERCLQENYYFREPATKAKMLDILFIFSKLNPDLSYRQGMHELLAPALWVVEHDAVDQNSLVATASAENDNLMLQMLDANYIEHDAFTIFCAIMQIARSFYEHDDMKSSTGQQGISAIISRSQHIHQVVLRRVDPELADHLQAIDVLPQIFLTRWIRLLFGREFSFEEVLRVWDLLFVENLRPSLIDAVCVAMLLRIRWQLLNSDYSSALTVLLRYPSPHPHRAGTFVEDGLYLEQNLTREGAAVLVSKYSGRVPTSGQSKIASPIASSKLAPRRRYQSQGALSSQTSESGSPNRSPARANTRGLDSFLQDVSEGLHRRAEGWGVAKVVRNAMTEARRNIQSIQSSANTPAFQHVDGLDCDSPSPPKSSFSHSCELSIRIATLEKRNKALAAMLRDALQELRSQTENSNISNDDLALRAIDVSLAKIQFVQVYLEDSTMPIPAEKITASGTKEVIGNEATSIISGSNSSAKSRDVASPVTTNISCEKPNSQNAISLNNNLSEKRVIQTAGLTRSVPVRPAARTALAESSFSWILGDTRHRSSFVTSATPPPEQRRNIESRGRPSVLFGDVTEGESRRSSNVEDDALALSSFRATEGRQQFR